MQHLYLNAARYSLSAANSEDPTWSLRVADSPSSADVKHLSANYAYWTTSGPVESQRTFRSLLTGDGLADPTWVAPVASVFTHPLAPQSTADIEYVHLSGQDLSLIATRALPSEEKTVIEYFNRTVQRYFITGRANEQRLLDALPQWFVRTGMQFRAHGAMGYVEGQRAPVCRFYAAPDRGGSNTHFYGTSNDCAALNTMGALRFEGFDFAATQPNRASTSPCPASAPNIVYRLFNNQSATNQGNHRYVVSEATLRAMQDRGWINEGAVFCSASVSDALN